MSQPKEQASNEYAGVTPPNVSALAALIRELDGNHNLGAKFCQFCVQLLQLFAPLFFGQNLLDSRIFGVL